MSELDTEISHFSNARGSLDFWGLTDEHCRWLRLGSDSRSIEEYIGCCLELVRFCLTEPNSVENKSCRGHIEHRRVSTKRDPNMSLVLC